jgi:hypothetical protein
MKGVHLLMQYKEKVFQQEFPFPNKIIKEENHVNVIF